MTSQTFVLELGQHVCKMEELDQISSNLLFALEHDLVLLLFSLPVSLSEAGSSLAWGLCIRAGLCQSSSENTGASRLKRRDSKGLGLLAS